MFLNQGYLVLFVLLFSCCRAFGFESFPVQGLGLEIRQYPTGTIPVGQYRFPLNQSVEGLAVLGLNVAYHGDQGIQSNESGLGFGGGIGVRDAVLKSFFVGGRLDFWKMSINWTNASNPNEAPSGTSRFLIVQPTLEIGSNFFVFNHRVWITPTLSFGGEFNTFDSGQPTGHGAIVLLGVAVGLF